MTKFNMFRDMTTSAALEQGGTWVTPFGPEADGYPAFLLARMGGRNQKYSRAVQSRLQQYQRLISTQRDNPDQGTLDLVSEKTKEAFCEAVLLDWRNVLDGDNKPLEFSKENAMILVNKIPEIYETLLGLAQSYNTFREADAKALEKN